MRPALPEVLNDRQQDNWDPLLAIADLAGGNWPKEARRAALAISGEKEDSASTGEELLSDIRDVFDACRKDRLWMKDILEKICEDELAPWSSWNRGKPMTVRQFGARLSGFGLRAKPLKIDRVVQKGFERKQFDDAWERYLSPDTPFSSVTGLQTFKNNDIGKSDEVTDGIDLGYQADPVMEDGKPNSPVTTPPVTPSVSSDPLKTLDNNRVTGPTRLAGKGKVIRI